MKTAEEILIKNLTQNALINLNKRGYDAILLAMKQHAEAEREKAFLDGFEKGTANGVLHPDDDSYDVIKMQEGLKEFIKQNPLT